MNYIIYQSEGEALQRSESEAISSGCTGSITKYWSQPMQTVDGTWALPVDGYLLTSDEQNNVIQDVMFPDPEEIDA